MWKKDGNDILIDGWGGGIADSPEAGIADMRNVNLGSVPGEVAVGFKNAALTLPPTGLGTVSFSAGGTVSYLVVGGGGQGGASFGLNGAGGGGGGGQVKTGTIPVVPQAIAITVGAGGSTGGSTDGGQSGSSSSIAAQVVSTGGGGGGRGAASGTAGTGTTAVNAGGGGGGPGGITPGAGGTGTGFNGGAGLNGSGGGGGAGASQIGADAAATGGNGGNGVASSISGASLSYGAGGGGSGAGGPVTSGAGGTGGGGAGQNNAVGTAGTANTGGGGGGAGRTGGSDFAGGAGGSGVVVISYTTGTITATGGTITTSGGNTIHTFTTSGTFTVTSISGYTADTLVVSSTTGYVNGMAIIIATSTVGGVTATNTYYIGNITSTAFKLYNDPFLAGSAVALTSGGTGTFTVPTFGTPVDRVSTASTSFDATTGENYKWDFVIDNAGLIWYIGNGANGTLNQLYFTGNTSHSTATTANVGAWKGYLFGLMATEIDYIKISTWLASGPTSNWHYAWKDTTASSVGHKAISATDDAFYFCNGAAVGSLFEKLSQTFNPTDSTTYNYNAAALDIPSFDAATCLAELGTTLLIGAISPFIYPWDRLSPSYNYPIILPETHTFNIVSANATAYVFAGKRGRIYLTNGANIQTFRKFPDQLANTETPYYLWGDAIYSRNKLCFGISATTNAGAAISTFAGVWAIDLDTKALYMMNSLSTDSYAGSVPVLLPMGNINPAGNGLYVGWINGSGTGGIDAGSTSPYIAGEAYIDCDLMNVGLYFSQHTFSQVEYKLSRPLVTGESIQVSQRPTLSDSFASVDTFTTTGLMAEAKDVNFENSQYLQLRINLTSTVTTPTYVRMTQLRIR